MGARAGFKALLVVCAVAFSLAFVPSAFGLVHEPKEVFGSAAQPTFGSDTSIAIDESTGDVLVVDEFARTISRFKPNGEASPFTALNTHVIDGARGPGNKPCAEEPSSCDETPANGLFFLSEFLTQVAMAPPGSDGGTAGNIYLTQRNAGADAGAIYTFAEDGRFVGSLTEAAGAPIDRLAGVAVDRSGNVYASEVRNPSDPSDSHFGIHKYGAVGNPVTNSDYETTIQFGVARPASLAVGTGPTEGFLFVAEINGPVYKVGLNSSVVEYELFSGAAKKIAVGAPNGRVYVGTESDFREYDASGPVEAVETSRTSTVAPGVPASGRVEALAVSSSGANVGDVLVGTNGSPHIGVWGPAIKLTPRIEDPATLSVSVTGATVEAEIGAEESPTTFWIEYGVLGPCSTNPCLKTPAQSAGEANAFVPVTAEITGLAPGTPYHWRVVASNEVGPNASQDLQFRTFKGFPFALPDGRVWEVVSPAEKWGGEAGIPGSIGGQNEYSVRPEQSSPDGDRMAFTSFTSFGDAEGASLTNQYVAQRAGDLWSTVNITPPFEEGYARDPIVGFSPDLAFSAVITKDPPLAAGATPHVWNLYRRSNVTGDYETVTNLPPAIGSGEEYCVGFGGASHDYSVVTFAVRNGALRSEDPAASGGTANLYAWTPSAGIDLISVLPDGTAASPTTTTAFGARRSWAGASACNMERSLLRHAISSNGSKIFWTYGGVYTGPKGPALFPLFARVDGTETVQLDAPNDGVAGPGGEGRYQDASVDGRRVFFTTGRRLTSTSAASNPRPDLYMYDFSRPLGDRVVDLTEGSAGAAVQGVLGVDSTGSTAYFVTTRVLGGSEPNPRGEVAEENRLNLYVWREGVRRFLAQLLPTDATNWGAPADETNKTPELHLHTSRVSDNGRFLVFRSTRRLTGYDNTRGAQDGTGRCLAECAEIFRYDFQANELRCVSCNPANARPIGHAYVPTWKVPYQQPRYLLDDGRVFFESEDRLDPNDVNGGNRDVYQYVPNGLVGCSAGSNNFRAGANGCLALLSRGTDADPSYLIDSSVDGSSVFISSRQRLVPAVDKDGASDVYAVRVGGKDPPPPPPTCLSADQCRGGGTNPGGGPGPASGGFVGPADPNPDKKRKCPRGKKRVVKKGKSRCARKRRVQKARGHKRRSAGKAKKARGGNK